MEIHLSFRNLTRVQTIEVNKLAKEIKEFDIELLGTTESSPRGFDSVMNMFRFDINKEYDIFNLVLKFRELDGLLKDEIDFRGTLYIGNHPIFLKNKQYDFKKFEEVESIMLKELNRLIIENETALISDALEVSDLTTEEKELMLQGYTAFYLKSRGFNRKEYAEKNRKALVNSLFSRKEVGYLELQYQSFNYGTSVSAKEFGDYLSKLYLNNDHVEYGVVSKFPQSYTKIVTEIIESCYTKGYVLPRLLSTLNVRQLKQHYNKVLTENERREMNFTPFYKSKFSVS